MDAAAFATTIPKAASAPSRRIAPQTIPINLIVRDRPLDEDEDGLSLDEELSDEEESAAGVELGAGVEVLPPPNAGFIGSAGALSSGAGAGGT